MIAAVQKLRPWICRLVRELDEPVGCSVWALGVRGLLCPHIHKQRPNIRKPTVSLLRLLSTTHFVYLSPGLPIQAGGAALQYRARFSVGVAGVCRGSFSACRQTSDHFGYEGFVGVQLAPIFGSWRPLAGCRRDQLAVCGSVSVPVPSQVRSPLWPSAHAGFVIAPLRFGFKRFSFLALRNPVCNASSRRGSATRFSFLVGQSRGVVSDENRPIQKQAWATAVLAASLSFSAASPDGFPPLLLLCRSRPHRSRIRPSCSCMCSLCEQPANGNRDLIATLGRHAAGDGKCRKLHGFLFSGNWSCRCSTNAKCKMRSRQRTLCGSSRSRSQKRAGLDRSPDNWHLGADDNASAVAVLLKRRANLRSRKPVAHSPHRRVRREEEDLRQRRYARAHVGEKIVGIPNMDCGVLQVARCTVKRPLPGLGPAQRG